MEKAVMTPAKQEAGTKQSSEAAALRAELARKIATHVRTDGLHLTAIPDFALYRSTAPTQCNPAHYEPSICLFVQGSKRINLGGATYLCDESSFLLTAVDVPVVSQVVAATKAVPLFTATVRLDMAVVREILVEGELAPAKGARPRGIAMGKTTPELLSAYSRLQDLLENPADIPFMSKLIKREIVYRLLQTPQGAHLREIATLGNQSHQTAKAIGWLRTNYAKPLRVEELAAIANMGMSTLHHQFRALTSMSPLQYQKQLRLVAAREMMLVQGTDAASAAFQVGYESPSQFSREYKRFFGQPPMTDVKLNRLAGDTVVGD
jgi:AraC-like DNA-binding protein